MSESLLIFLVTQAFNILGGIIGIYVKVSIKLKELDIRQGVVENRVLGVEKQDNVIIEKLDDIKDDVSQIRVDMQNKQNRA
jgi:hypothetical protein